MNPSRSNHRRANRSATGLQASSSCSFSFSRTRLGRPVRLSWRASAECRCCASSMATKSCPPRKQIPPRPTTRNADWMISTLSQSCGAKAAPIESSDITMIICVIAKRGVPALRAARPATIEDTQAFENICSTGSPLRLQSMPPTPRLADQIRLLTASSAVGACSPRVSFRRAPAMIARRSSNSNNPLASQAMTGGVVSR